MIMFSTDEAVHPLILGRRDRFVPLIVDFPGSGIESKFTAMHHDVTSTAPQTLEVCYVFRGESLEISARLLSVGLVDQEDTTHKAAAERRIREHFVEGFRSSGSEDDHVDISHGELTMLERVPRERRRGIKELGKSINELITLLISSEEDRELIRLDKRRLLFCICWYYVTVDELLGRSFSIDNADVCYIAQCTISDVDAS